MKYSIEDILVELIWQWLDEVKGYQVDGEVTLGGSGRIDLVAKTPSGKYLGFEVKNQSGFAPSDDTKLFKQLIKYRNSRFLDKLYYCSQSSADMVDKLRRSVDIDMYPQQYVKGPKELGGLTVNFQDNRIDGQNTCKIVREAAQLNRKYQPKISKSSESWVCHHIWKNYGLLREGVLPNRDTNKCQYIDVMRQIGSPDPTEIYLNQEDDGYAHVGIEAKGDISLGKTVLTQLRQQYESGGITELTLAVPSFKRHSAEELLSQNTQSTLSQFGTTNQAQDDADGWVQDVGIVTVDENGECSVVREPASVRMTIDGFRTADTNGRFLEVGRGGWRERDEFCSTYDIHR